MIEIVIAIIIQVSALTGDVTTIKTSQVTDLDTNTTEIRTTTTTSTVVGGTGNWDDNN